VKNFFEKSIDFFNKLVYNILVRLREEPRAAPFSIGNRYRTRRKENGNANAKKRTEKIFSKISEKTLDKSPTLWYNISTVRDRPTE
jgi:hypothetical protein